MKNKQNCISRSSTLILVVTIIAFCSLAVSAQTSSDSDQLKLPSMPLQESFSEATGLVLPWIVSGCDLKSIGKIKDCHYIFAGRKGGCEDFANATIEGVPIGKIPNCFEVAFEQIREKDSDITSLYNNNGSLWYRYGNEDSRPDYFKKNPKDGFLPFATIHRGIFRDSAILRLVAESPNWYEVEINEKTRATKFVLKSDPKWAKMTWEYWLGKEYLLTFNFNGPARFHDKPNGNIIKGLEDYTIGTVVYLDQTDGEWALFKTFNLGDKNAQTYQGWIRWRDGRNLLVFSNLRINEVETDDENK